MSNYKGQHRFFPITRKLPYQFCAKCGIITLRNKATHKVINKPCKDQDDDND